MIWERQTLHILYKQGQWNQTAVCARHALHKKSLNCLQTLSLKTVILQDLKWNPIHWHAVNAQICRTVLWAPVSPQFPTNKMLPKSPPPLQSHFNGCVYGSCHHVSEATFNTLTSSGTLSQDPTWGMARMCPPEQAPQPGLHLAKQWHAMHRWPQGKAASHPGLGESHGAAWAEQSTVGSPASRNLVCLPKGNVWGDTHQIIHFKLHMERPLPAFTAQQPRRAGSLTFPLPSLL